MTLENVFSKSWQDIKRNIVSSLKLSWWLFVLPCLVLLLIGIVMFMGFVVPVFSEIQNAAELNSGSFGSFLTLTGNAIGDEGGISSSMMGGIILIFVLLVVICAIFFSIYYISLLYMAVYNEKGNLKIGQIIDGGLKYFWRIIGLGLIIWVIFMGLFLAALVVSVIFFMFPKALLFIGIIVAIFSFLGAFVLWVWLGVRWIFSPFVIVRENTGIIESMKRSSLIVKGKWWKTFGCFLLFYLIITAMSYMIMFVIEMFLFSFMFLIIMALMGGPVVFGIVLFILAGVVITMYGLTSGILGIVFAILIKNLYLDVRNEKSRKLLK